MKIECDNKDCFHMKYDPFKKIIFDDYISRIRKFLTDDESIWILTYRLIERSGLCLCHRSFPFLFAAAMTLALKREDDFFLQNSYISRVFGIDVKKLNEIEIKVLLALNFELYEKNELTKDL